MSTIRLAFCLLMGAAIAACGSSGGTTQSDAGTKQVEDPYHTTSDATPAPQGQEGWGFLFGDSKKSGSGVVGLNGVGVNSYLWHATLDTVSFMPLASADPFGGVIITDWYSPADLPNERFKLNVLILGRELQANAVRVTVFRQKRNEVGQWIDAPVEAKTGTDLENAILLRARQLRISTAAVK
jgi:hypothetical protein